MAYPSSYYDINPIHNTVHLQQMRDIAHETIENEVPTICRNICYDAINKAFNSAMSGMKVDINRIVDITCKEMNAQFHSEEVSHFMADVLQRELVNALSDIDLKLIIS